MAHGLLMGWARVFYLWLFLVLWLILKCIRSFSMWRKSFRDGFWVHICHFQIVYLVNFSFQLVGELWAWCCDIWMHFEVLGWLIPYTELHLRSTAQMLKVNSKETQSFFSQRGKKKKQEPVHFPQQYFSTSHHFGALQSHSNTTFLISPPSSYLVQISSCFLFRNPESL